MSDQIELTPDERELEKALRSLRPAPAHIEPISVSRASGYRLWPFAAAAAVLIAVGGAWLMWGQREVATDRIDHQFPVIAVTSDQPTLLVYRRALAQSPEELDALLDRQATIGATPNNETLPKRVLTLWNAKLNSIGEM